MNKKAKNPQTQEKDSKFAIGGKIAAAGALLAVIAGGITNSKQIYEQIFGQAVDVRVGWITLKDPSSFECTIGGGARFKVSKDKFIGLVDNACLTDLRQRIESIKTTQVQRVKSSYFLIIDNVGPDVDEITIAGNAPGSQPLLKAHDVRKGDSIAMCVGFQGLSGSASHNDAPEKLVVERKGKLSEDVPIPKRDTYSLINKTDCPGVGFGYPDMSR